jgi:hypothetical protein
MWVPIPVLPRPGAWLAHVTLADRPEAVAKVKLARALDEANALTAAGLAVGDYSVAHAAVIVRALVDLPADLEPDLVARAEKTMIEEAVHLTPKQLRTVGRHLLEVVAPRKNTKPEPDPVTGRVPDHATRMGHGLCEVLEHLPTDGYGDHGGLAAALVVTLDHEVLKTGLGAATLVDGTEVSSGEARRLACDAGIIPAVLGGTSAGTALWATSRRITSVSAHTRTGFPLKLLPRHSFGRAPAPAADGTGATLVNRTNDRRSSRRSAWASRTRRSPHRWPRG